MGEESARACMHDMHLPGALQKPRRDRASGRDPERLADRPWIAVPPPPGGQRPGSAVRARPPRMREESRAGACGGVDRPLHTSADMRRRFLFSLLAPTLFASLSLVACSAPSSEASTDDSDITD